VSGSVAPETGVDAEDALRPLLLATVGAGVMTLGLLQFWGDLLEQLEIADRTRLLHGIRSSFFAFLGTSAALLAAYLFRAYDSARLSALFNVYGAACFLGAVIVAGGHIGATLGRLAGLPEGQGVTVGGFFLFSMVGLAALFAASLLSALKRRVRRPVPHLSDPE
jgi:hypothetical protein